MIREVQETTFLESCGVEEKNNKVWSREPDLAYKLRRLLKRKGRERKAVVMRWE